MHRVKIFRANLIFWTLIPRFKFEFLAIVRRVTIFLADFDVWNKVFFVFDALTFLLFSHWFHFHSVFWNNFFLPKSKMIWCLFRNLNFSQKFTAIEVFYWKRELIWQGCLPKYRDVQARWFLKIQGCANNFQFSTMFVFCCCWIRDDHSLARKMFLLFGNCSLTV